MFLVNQTSSPRSWTSGSTPAATAEAATTWEWPGAVSPQEWSTMAYRALPAPWAQWGIFERWQGQWDTLGILKQENKTKQKKKSGARGKVGTNIKVIDIKIFLGYLCQILILI